MSAFAYVRRGAGAAVCVLALGAADAVAQQSPEQSPPTAAGAEGAKPAEPAGTQATPPASTAPTSDLPELVVDGQDKEKKKKKAAKTQQGPVVSPAATAADVEPTQPPPGLVLGGAPSDTGTTTFDANAVDLRANGAGDANSFMRNLPNVQYQNQAVTGGMGSQKAVDTKPAAVSISGGRTYENNFIVNGVSVNNIAGTAERGGNTLTDTSGNPDGLGFYGQSSQTIYVPTDFIGQATVVDSNASAEYGQFQGGVVIYDLIAPPTDRYHASVSASREDSDYASYILRTPDARNTSNRKQPFYEKDKLAVSVGAPVTPDFSFIGQASRLEADSGKPRSAGHGDTFAYENSDNVFFRFAATARTDIGKLTLDTSITDYFQNWEAFRARPGDGIMDINTDSSSTKIEHLADLPGVRADEIGLGRVKVKTWAFYNTTETTNTSPDNVFFTHTKQRVSAPVNGVYTKIDFTMPDDWCPGVASPALAPLGTQPIPCATGGFGNTLSSQTDYGVQTLIDGALLFGSFKAGAEIKHYDAERARSDDVVYGSSSVVLLNNRIYSGNTGNVAANAITKFNCPPGDRLCTDNEYSSSITSYAKYHTAAQINAAHTFAEIDQTLGWFNLRAGARLDYEDYTDNINIAPRLAATVKPFDGISITGGFNQYYLGETLYYALRSGQPDIAIVQRTHLANGNVIDIPALAQPPVRYNFDSLKTPYDDEYTAAVGIRDPLLQGQWRLKYLERKGRDQFSTGSCGNNCFAANNDGETSFRSATAEYTKTWDRLHNPFYLNAAAITGNVTWSEQSRVGGSYLFADFVGDGSEEQRYLNYKGKTYLSEQFTALTGNMDIPVRFGATVATLWFDSALELNASAGVNLGYEGIGFVRNASVRNTITNTNTLQGLYDDRKFTPTLKLDLSGKIHVTDQAYVEFFADNITNSRQNIIATYDNPWVLGRTFWIGSGLNF